MINNRQNGRRRGRGGNNNGGGNGQRSGNPGRPDSGNRIDSRARGNANQLYEKYKNLARDAQMSGDRVNTEYYLQFADHYFRVLSETRTRFEEQNPNAAPQRRIQPVDSFDDFDGDDDYADEGEPIRAGEQGGQDARDQQRGQQEDSRQGNQRDNGRDANRQQGQRDGQPRYDNQPRYEGRRDEPRVDDGRNAGARRNGYAAEEGDGARGQRSNDQPRDQQVRDQSARDQQPRHQQVEQDRSSERFAVTGSPIANDMGEDSPDGAEPSPVEPRRRGRPRRVVQEAVSGTDTVETPAAPDADSPVAFDADRLPPSLSLSAATGDAADDQEAARPRRRRVRAAASDASSPG